MKVRREAQLCLSQIFGLFHDLNKNFMDPPKNSNHKDASLAEAQMQFYR